MIEILKEVWGELYWNTSDWLPWLAMQTLLAAFFAAIAQWWFNIRWPVVLTLALALILSVNIYRLPPSPISRADVAKMNASLPREFEGITIESVSFAHRVFTFSASSPEPLEVADLKKSVGDDSGLVAEQCEAFGKWLATQQIKQIQYVWSWPGGTYSHAIEARDCQKD